MSFLVVQIDVFLDITREELTRFRSRRHVMFTMGDDFHYARAKQVRKDRNVLIFFFFEGGEVNFFGSQATNSWCW